MFEQRKVMRKIYKKGIPTPYSLEEMIKCVIELDDIEAICFFLKANIDISSVYIKLLLTAAINIYKTGDEGYLIYLLKLCNKMNFKTKAEISDVVNKINDMLDMHYSYHRGYSI